MWKYNRHHSITPWYAFGKLKWHTFIFKKYQIYKKNSKAPRYWESVSASVSLSFLIFPSSFFIFPLLNLTPGISFMFTSSGLSKFLISNKASFIMDLVQTLAEPLKKTRICTQRRKNRLFCSGFYGKSW